MVHYSQLLMSDKLKASIPPLYYTETIPCEEKKIICRFGVPGSWWVWNVVEGEEQEDGDWLFFGLVEGAETEWGYFRLSDFEGQDWPKGIGVTLI